MFATLWAYHWPPRAVGIPRAFNASASLAASDRAQREKREREQRLDAEGITGAANAFQETKALIGALEAALKSGVDEHIEFASDGEWFPSNGRDYYMIFYKLSKPSRGQHELAFHLTGDYQRVEFENYDFAIADQLGIQDAIKAWVVAKLG